MRRWLPRLVLILFVIIWLLVMSFPFVAFRLTTRDEITVGSSESSHLRLFMVRADEEKGLGLEWTRSLDASECFVTKVKYILWEGNQPGQNTSFCFCPDSGTNLAIDQPPCEVN